MLLNGDELPRLDCSTKLGERANPLPDGLGHIRTGERLPAPAATTPESHGQHQRPNAREAERLL